MAPKKRIVKAKCSRSPSASTCTDSNTFSSSWPSTRSSRLDSYLSTSPSASFSAGKSSRRTRSSSGTSRTSRSSASSGKSILKKKKKSINKKNTRPIGQFARIKDDKVKEEVQDFLQDYSKVPSADFEAFSLTVDGIPFVAVSLMNADEQLRVKFEAKKTVPPPTPMKTRTPGLNSPRKRPLTGSRRSNSSGIRSKAVRFTDEQKSAKRGRKSRSMSPEEIQELSETISDAMIDTDEKYRDLWNDRAE